MKLPFRGRPLGDDDYDYDDEDEEFDPSPPPSGRPGQGPIRIGASMAGPASGAAGPFGGAPAPAGGGPHPPASRTPRLDADLDTTGETPAVGQPRASAPPPVTSSARLRSGSLSPGRPRTRPPAPVDRTPERPPTAPAPRPDRARSVDPAVAAEAEAALTQTGHPGGLPARPPTRTAPPPAVDVARPAVRAPLTPRRQPNETGPYDPDRQFSADDGDDDEYAPPVDYTADDDTADDDTADRGRGVEDRDARSEAGRQLAPAPEVVTADEFADELHRLGRETGSEQRSAWAYLGLMGVLFVLVVGFGYGCSGHIGGADAPLAPGEMLTSAQPTRLVFKIEGELVTLTGSVPDEAARDQVVLLAKAAYKPENVVDALAVDAGTTFDGGSIRVVGSAINDDKRPGKLRDQVVKSLGLADRGFEVGFTDRVLAPVAAVVSINGPKVSLSGTLPDAQAVSTLTSLAGEVWGAPNTEAGNLTVGETTWSRGRIQLAGSAVATDPRIVLFTSLVSQRIGADTAVDTSGLAPGDNASAVAAAQSAISTLVSGSPIKFAADSATIDQGSDAVLLQLAAALGQVPNTAVEIVGHTDSQGDDQHNLVLSQSRAKSVLDRLASLGVSAERLNSRGEGEANPVADNNTEEGRAANRRIDFLLVGPPTSPVVTPPPATPSTTTG